MLKAAAALSELDAGRGRPVSSAMETPRPRGALENRIFIVPHDLFKLTAADENTGGPRFVGAEVATERDPPPKTIFS